MQNEKAVPPKRTLPGFAGWLVGYAATLAAAAGLAYFWRVAFALDEHLPPLWPTLGAMALASVLYAAVYLLHRFCKDICKRAAALVLLCGTLFCFAAAPLQAPDELAHYLRANAISHGQFTYNYNYAYPEDVHLLAERFPPALAHRVQHGGEEMAPARLEDYLAARAAGRAAGEEAAPPVMFLLVPFLPQGGFMALARLFGLGALGQMYAGRLANLLVYALLCYFALKNTARGRSIMLAFCLLPLSLFMAASCNYDGLMLGLCYLLGSYLGKDAITRRDLGVFLAALALACYIKPNNVLLALNLLLIPKDRWLPKAGEAGGGRLPPRRVARNAPNWRRWQVVLAVAAVGLALWWGLGWLDSNVLKTGYPADLGRGSGDAAAPAAQLAFVLQNPLRFAATTLLSVYEADGFLFDLGRFGWMDLAVPLVGGLAVLALFLAAVLGAQRPAGTGRRWAITGPVLAGLLYAAAVLAGMYVLDTDLMSIRITGQQPRYFLPAFLLLAFGAAAGLGRVVRLRPGAEAAARRERVFLWMCAALGLFAAILLFQNYYVGQWLPKAAGGWRLVNLFT